MKILEYAGGAGLAILIAGLVAKFYGFPQITFWASIISMVLSWLYVWYAGREYAKKSTKVPSDLLLSVALPFAFFIAAFALAFVR